VKAEQATAANLDHDAALSVLLREMRAARDDLQAVRSEVAALRAELAASRAPQLQDDAGELAVLLPAAWQARGESVWCVADLVVDGIVEQGDARRVGRLLARNACAAIGDLTLQSVGADREGRAWVLRVLNRLSPASCE
jgi:hypothetical protein